MGKEDHLLFASIVHPRTKSLAFIEQGLLDEFIVKFENKVADVVASTACDSSQTSVKSEPTDSQNNENSQNGGIESDNSQNPPLPNLDGPVNPHLPNLNLDVQIKTEGSENTNQLCEIPYKKGKARDQQ